MSSELATSYAALILTDDHVEITVKYRSNNTTSSNDRRRWMNGYNNHCNSGLNRWPIVFFQSTASYSFASNRLTAVAQRHLASTQRVSSPPIDELQLKTDFNLLCTVNLGGTAGYSSTPAATEQLTLHPASTRDNDNADNEEEPLCFSSDKLQTLLKAANVEVESIWTSLFAKALEGKDVAAMLSNVGAAGSAPAAGAAAPAGGAAAAEEKAEEKKEEAKEESDDDMGFGLFD
ncbi:MAG: 60s acidic ribosomal protein-domain-containing protein [Linnemannia elongata]|nr:MAG: 60s acidic ribosomal protein-domain-containing protein [Linnemannia elongata]